MVPSVPGSPVPRATGTSTSAHAAAAVVTGWALAGAAVPTSPPASSAAASTGGARREPVGRGMRIEDHLHRLGTPCVIGGGGGHRELGEGWRRRERGIPLTWNRNSRA